MTAVAGEDVQGAHGNGGGLARRIAPEPLERALGDVLAKPLADCVGKADEGVVCLE